MTRRLRKNLVALAVVAGIGFSLIILLGIVFGSARGIIPDNKTTELILVLLGFCALLCLAIDLILQCYLMLTIGRRFEKIFHNVECLGSWYMWGQKIGRLDTYIEMIRNYEFFKNSNSSDFQALHGYNFLNYAKKSELFFIKIYHYSMLFFILFIALFAVGYYMVFGQF